MGKRPGPWMTLPTQLVLRVMLAELTREMYGLEIRAAIRRRRGGGVMNHLGHWARTAAGVLAVGRLLPAAGWAALAAALITAVMVGWILSCPQRTARAAALITAVRGHAPALPAPALPAPAPAPPTRRRRRGRRRGGTPIARGDGRG